MLTYATTFQPLPEEAGASQESWRIWLQSPLFLFVLITALVLKRLASSPATQLLLLLEILEAKGMKVLYLPPYSPDLNPIEKMWSKMKAILRCWKIRSLDLLPDAIQKALSCVSPLDCSHWFATSDYC